MSLRLRVNLDQFSCLPLHTVINIYVQPFLREVQPLDSKSPVTHRNMYLANFQSTYPTPTLVGTCTTNAFVFHQQMTAYSC